MGQGGTAQNTHESKVPQKESGKVGWNCAHAQRLFLLQRLLSPGMPGRTPGSVKILLCSTETVRMEWNKGVSVWAEDLQSDLLLGQPQLSDPGLPP